MLDQIVPVAIGLVVIIAAVLALAALLKVRKSRIREHHRMLRDDHNRQIYDDWEEAQNRWDDQKTGS